MPAILGETFGSLVTMLWCAAHDDFLEQVIGVKPADV